MKSTGRLCSQLLFLFLCLLPLSYAKGSPRAMVRPGIERVFEAPFLDWLKGKRVGVLAHAASRDHAGRHLVDLLHARRDLSLKVIFAPEHGFRGGDDTQVPDSKDPRTGLPVYSLYGPRRAPTPELLAGLDALVIDLQDVGVRYYTYGATVAWTLEACARARVPVVLLDRPNPLGGVLVAGAVLDPRLAGTITAFAPIATRHAMTLGELERLYNTELALGAELRVVPLEGWHREMRWSETGLPWVAPSPALTTAEQAELYAVFGALEALNLSVGRSRANADAFRVFGAPWITERESRGLVSRLTRARLAGVRFEPARWTPDRSEYEGQLCRGVRLTVTDPRALAADGFRALLTTLRALRLELGNRLTGGGALDRMLGAAWVREELAAGRAPDEIAERARAEARRFLSQRAAALLY